MGLGGDSEDEKLEKLIEAIDDLKQRLATPMTIKEILPGNVTEEQFFNEVDNMAVQAFDDQCTGANPRYPMMADLKALYLTAYFGRDPGDNFSMPAAASAASLTSDFLPQ